MPKRTVHDPKSMTMPERVEFDVETSEDFREMMRMLEEKQREIREDQEAAGGVYAGWLRRSVDTAHKTIEGTRKPGQIVGAGDAIEDYASRLLSEHQKVLRAIQQGDADGAAYFAFEVGRLAERRTRKLRDERDALDGRHTQARRCEGGREGAKKKADEAAPRHARIRSLVAELTPSEGFKGAKSLAAERLGVTVRTVERALSRKSTDTS